MQGTHGSKTAVDVSSVAKIRIFRGIALSLLVFLSKIIELQTKWLQVKFRHLTLEASAVSVNWW